METFIVQLIGLGMGTGLQVGLIALALGWLWRIKDMIS